MWEFPDEGKAAMSRLLVDDIEDVRARAANALKEMGILGAAILASQLRESNVIMRGACVDALRSMGATGAAALASQLTDQDVTTRCVAAGALGRMCEQAFAHSGALST